MTEIKMVIEDSNGYTLEQTIKNERPMSDIRLQDEIDMYINEYILAFNKENYVNGSYLKSLKMYWEGNEIRNIQKDSE
jgi:hypothetical protein